MSFLQLRIHCADNSAPFYRKVAAPLQAMLARQDHDRWTLARGTVMGAPSRIEHFTNVK